MLLAAIEQGLGEAVEPLVPSASAVVASAAAPLQAPAAGSWVQGVSASPGIASGPAHVCVERDIDYHCVASRPLRSV